MFYFHSSLHSKHQIGWEVFNGDKEMASEKPQRVEAILTSLQQNNFLLGNISVIDEQYIDQIHTPKYLHFLKSVSSLNFKKLYPSVWNYSHYLDLLPEKSEALAGRFAFDTFTPFTDSIWEVASESVNIGFSATNYVLQTNKPAYALCRPPGHHATKDQAGGYCYLANSSIIAQYLLQMGKKPCILDIDYHHGNGAQEIWYNSNKVLTISIHRNPVDKFPYYSGLENEIGVDSGLGWNYNFCLPKGTSELGYLKTLDKALVKITEHNCDFLIVSAGFDTYKLDPICDFALEIESFSRIAQKINSLQIPTVILQEGGYHLQDLGKCVVSFLNGFNS